MRKNEKRINLQLMVEGETTSILKKELKNKTNISEDIEELIIRNGQLVSIKLKEISNKDLFDLFSEFTESIRSIKGDITIKDTNISTYGVVKGFEYYIWADKEDGDFVFFQDFLLDYEQLVEAGLNSGMLEVAHKAFLGNLNDLGVELVFISTNHECYENLMALKINARFLEVAHMACDLFNGYNELLADLSEEAGISIG